MHAEYGTTDGFGDSRSLGQKALPRRWRLNSIAMVEAVLVPSSIFIVVYWLLSFQAHDYYPTQTVALALLCILVPAGLWHRVWVQQTDMRDLSHREPNWFFFLAAACSVAWLSGFALGTINWTTFMHRYYQYSDLAMITGVSTRATPGGAVLDAGVIEFTHNTDVSEDLNMGYKAGDLFCVAPIVTRAVNSSAPATYDYWAVGMNCCDPFKAKIFQCGDVLEDQARGGLRLMDTSDISSFRKAIQMAEQEYHIKAGNNPLLLFWEGDAIKEIELAYATGWKAFWQNSIAFVGLAAAVMLAYALFLSKVNR